MNIQKEEIIDKKKRKNNHHQQVNIGDAYIIKALNCI